MAVFALYLNLPIIGPTKIELEDQQLLEFSKRQLAHYLQRIEENRRENKTYVIKIKADNNLLCNKFSEIVKEEKILSRGMKISNGVLCNDLPKKYERVKYRWSANEVMVITSSIEYSLPVKIYATIFNDKYSRNHKHFYQLVLFPLFSLYALLDDYYPVHGSAIRINNKTIIISGLDGVGKSTLTEALVSYGGNILSDNFTIFNGKDVVPLIMPLRMPVKDSTKQKEIYKNGSIKEIMPPISENKEQSVDYIYYLVIGKRLKLVKLEADKQTLLNSLCFGANEVRDANNSILAIQYAKLNEKVCRHQYRTLNVYSLEIPRSKIHEGAELLKSTLFR